MPRDELTRADDARAAQSGGGCATAPQQPAHEAFPLLTEAVSADAAPLFAENLRRGA